MVLSNLDLQCGFLKLFCNGEFESIVEACFGFYFCLFHGGRHWLVADWVAGEKFRGEMVKGRRDKEIELWIKNDEKITFRD